MIVDRENRERERYTVVYGATLEVRDGDPVESNHAACRVGPVHLRDPHRPVRGGDVQDIEAGVTMKEEVDEVTGFSRQIIVQSQDEKKHPQLLDAGMRPARV